MFKTKEHATEWALDQLKKVGIRNPNSYSEKELRALNPDIPKQFIKNHVEKRKEKTNVSV